MFALLHFVLQGIQLHQTVEETLALTFNAKKKSWPRINNSNWTVCPFYFIIKYPITLLPLRHHFKKLQNIK